MKISHLFIAAMIAASGLAACSSDPPKQEESRTSTDSMMLAEGERVIYVCPMPEDSIISDKPGNCPKCGMELERMVVKDTAVVK